ncbi:MAG: hypothetical protein WB992_09750 [Bryobacteraceae bacterium]
MTSKQIALTLTLCSACLFAQEAPTEPEYVNQYYVLKDGKLERLEHENLKLQHKTNDYFVTVKGSSIETVNGTHSPVRLGTDAHFIVRMQTGDIDPATMVKLQPFKVGKNDREILMNSGGAHLFGGVHSKAADDISIAVTVKKYGTNSFEVVPSRPLAPGEYFFTVMGLQADCFGVDAK